jgi:hypothetical protein
VETASCIERWTRDFVPDTKRHSLLAINRFEKISGLDADKFLEFAKSHDSVETLDLIKKVRDNFDNSVAVNFENHMRSFLKHNGVTNLPISKNSYPPKTWHRGYNREELRKLLGYLAQKNHKLFALIAIESGLRAQTILDIRYRHVQQDLEKGIVPVAIRFEPKYYSGSKSAGFTFLGERSVALLREMIEEKLIRPKPDTPIILGEPEGSLVPGRQRVKGKKKKHNALTYPSIQVAIRLAKRKAGIDSDIQPNHGFRKYFENALDHAGLDVDKKRLLEGHLGDTRAKHYTGREWEDLRPLYKKAYPQIDPETEDPSLTEETKTLLSDLQKRVRQLEEEKIAWTDQFIKLLTEWGSGKKADTLSVKEFARFLLEHGSVKKDEDARP